MLGAGAATLRAEPLARTDTQIMSARGSQHIFEPDPPPNSAQTVKLQCQRNLRAGHGGAHKAEVAVWEALLGPLAPPLGL